MSEVDFLVGERLVEIRYGHGVRLVFDAGDEVEPNLYADLGRFTVAGPDGVEHEVDEKDPRSLGPALALVGKAVETTATPDDASLELTFSDGSRLHCAAHARFEAWQVVGGSPQYLVVSVGPGDLHVYDDPTPRRLPRLS